ncbi:MAG: TonB-dependent receptor [Bdellovibrionota bacterium]
MQSSKLETNRKALEVNLDNLIYGTFAEIGAGQEVARRFFRVGAAAGTIAKTMSAYDMKFSNEIYGESSRFVSRERLLTMFDHEYQLLIERLGQVRGEDATFFVFADTVSAKNFKGTNECHGWLGVRFQTEPLGPPHDVLIHVNLTDSENLAQQEALGILGVNLIYATFFKRGNLKDFIKSLQDSLSLERLEVDMIEFHGPAFANVNNRLLSFKLVQFGLTNAVMFDPEEGAVLPSGTLRKRPVLIERGSFRPINKTHVDMIFGAQKQFAVESQSSKKPPLSILEITVNNLLEREEISDERLLRRVDSMLALGMPVLVTNYSEYFHLTTYLRRYTDEAIGFVIGVNSLLQIFNDKYYEHLEGGILEAFCKLFGHKVKLYVYPMLKENYTKLAETAGIDSSEIEIQTEDIVTAENIGMPIDIRYL